MRLNSAADSAFIAERLGFAPPGLVGLATDFRLGEALVAGKIAPHPAVAASLLEDVTWAVAAYAVLSLTGSNSACRAGVDRRPAAPATIAFSG